MSTLAVQPIVGLYHAQPQPSNVGFGVRHSGVFWYRGTLSDISATLRGDADNLLLEGSARVDSISVLEPAPLRTHLLDTDFFDAEHHPELTFRSSAVLLNGEQRAEVHGELTMRGVSCPVRAFGQYAGPTAAAFGEVVGLELHTSVDRRRFGFDWQAQLPDGGDALGWDVELDIDLLFIREQTA